METEIKKTQSLEKFESNFFLSLQDQKFKLDAFKENARFKIVSQKKLEESKIVLTNIKAMKDNVKFLEDSYYKPIYNFSKIIYNPIKELKDEIKKIEDFHKDEQLSWLRKLAEEEKKKREELEKKLQKQEISLEEAGKKLEKVELKSEAIKGVTTRKVVKIVDFSKVPDKYKEINMPLLNNDVLRGGVVVPGTQVVEEQSISNR